MNKKIIISSFVGNALEFFDFTLCGVFMMTLSKVFFPETNPNLSILAGIFAFSAAFYTRPIGALLFGYLGDRYGRKTTLSMTVFLMGIPTFIIGILPSYETIGLFAPIILIFCRLMQGLCTGGEYNGAAIFALEHVQKARPGLVSGLISSSCVIGALSATILGGIFLSESSSSWFWVQPSWFWRIPFLIGALVSVVGYFLRRYTFETVEFMKYKEFTSQNQNTTDYKNYVNQFFVSISVGALNGALSYTLFGFLNVYMTKFVGFRMLQGIWCNAVGLVAFGLSCIAAGALSDRLGERKAVTYSACFAGIMAFPAFSFLIQAEISPVLLGQILLGIAVGSFIGTNHFFLQSLFSCTNSLQGGRIWFLLGNGNNRWNHSHDTNLHNHAHTKSLCTCFFNYKLCSYFLGSLRLLPKKSITLSEEKNLMAA